jgi:hypothetical protein
MLMARSLASLPDAGQHVEIAFAGLVVQPLHVAFDQHDRLAVDRENSRVHVLASERENFIPGRTMVRTRLVVRRRHLQS